jgi:ribose 5-phosphate isomerase B
MTALRVAVGSDHAGFEGPAPYKPELIAHLGIKGLDVINCGTDDSASVDYPDIAERVCGKVVGGEADLGLLVCGSGIGMCMTANRIRGIRAADCTSPKMAQLAREHNHANVLCLGTRLLSLDECRAIIDAFIAEPWSTNERHRRRVEKMDRLGGDVLS